MGSGDVAVPQSWNRYSYVTNNPLKYTDPLGLFLWDDSAGGNWSDEALLEIINDRRQNSERREAFRKMYDFRQKFKRVLMADPYLRAFIGFEGEINGVTVGLGNVISGRSETVPGRQSVSAQNGKMWMVVQIRFVEGLSDEELRIQTNHEVDHAALVEQFVRLSNANPTEPNPFGILGTTVEAAEMSAYERSAMTAKEIGRFDYTLETGGQRFTIWRRGMTTVDKNVLRQYLQTDPHYKNQLNTPFFK